MGRGGDEWPDRRRLERRMPLLGGSEDDARLSVSTINEGGPVTLSEGLLADGDLRFPFPFPYDGIGRRETGNTGHGFVVRR